MARAASLLLSFVAGSAAVRVSENIDLPQEAFDASLLTIERRRVVPTGPNGHPNLEDEPAYEGQIPEDLKRWLPEAWDKTAPTPSDEARAPEVPTPAPPPPSVTRVIILGNQKTGKSTLCQWLLGRTDVCQVHEDLREFTTSYEFAKGYWFNDPELGELEVMDGPGFTLQAGDGAAWTEFVAEAKSKFSMVDAVIFTSNYVSQLGELRHAAMNKLRQTFGSSLWENFVNFVPIYEQWQTTEVQQWTGYTDAEWADLQLYWEDTFLHVEFNESVVNWAAPENAAAKTILEGDIDVVKYYGSYLKTSAGWPMVQAHNPDYNQPGFPTRSEADLSKRYIVSRVRYLPAMREHILAKRNTREGGAQWDLSSVYPRFGPSQVTQGQMFECKWPHDCSFEVAGAYLSDADQLRVFPASHECGTSFAGFTEDQHVPVEYQITRPSIARPALTHEKSFILGATNQLNQLGAQVYKLCYCEYGSCTSPQRFFQEVGHLSVENDACVVPCDAAGANAQLVGGQACGDQEIILLDEFLQYECDLGHGLNAEANRNVFTRKCNSGGQLEALAFCDTVQCPSEPQVPSYAIRTTPLLGQEHRWKDLVSFVCDGDGFSLDANPEGGMRIDVECGPVGEWLFPAFQTEPRESWPDFLAGGGCRKWATGAWGDCTAPNNCGSGKHRRDVSCTANICNEVFRPGSEQDCVNYTGCSSCGKAPDLTAVHAFVQYVDDPSQAECFTGGAPVYYDCDHHNGYTLDGSDSVSYEKTSFKASCQLLDGAAEPEIVWERFDSQASAWPEEDVLRRGCRKWELSEWSACSSTCGSGYRFREVQCSTGADADCAADAKPVGLVTTRACFVDQDCPTRGSQSQAWPSAGRAVLALLLGLSVSLGATTWA